MRSEQLDLADLWNRYGDELVGFVRRRLSGISRAGEDAEDVVQDVFLSLHRNPPDHLVHPRGFLYLCVRRKLMELVVSNRATKAAPIDPDNWHLTEQPTPVEDFDAMLLICSALSTLSEFERAVAIHRFMYGHIEREVGEILGISRYHVHQIAERAAHELRINLAVLDDGERIDPTEAAARKRRLLFEAAAQIGVRAACLQFGVSTSSYFVWQNQDLKAIA
jgi:RNA polymerase sigma factor (sigma-70 family)